LITVWLRAIVTRSENLSVSLTIICQECRRKPACWNFEIAPGYLRAMCDDCKRKTDKAMTEDIKAARNAAMMTPEEFLDERFAHLKPPYRSLALKAIRGERMPLSRIDGQPEAQSIKDAWNEYQRAALRRSDG
jgi:hypothetical protein